MKQVYMRVLEDPHMHRPRRGRPPSRASPSHLWNPNRVSREVGGSATAGYALSAAEIESYLGPVLRKGGNRHADFNVPDPDVVTDHADRKEQDGPKENPMRHSSAIEACPATDDKAVATPAPIVDDATSVKQRVQKEQPTVKGSWFCSSKSPASTCPSRRQRRISHSIEAVPHSAGRIKHVINVSVQC